MGGYLRPVNARQPGYNAVRIVVHIIQHQPYPCKGTFYFF